MRNLIETIRKKDKVRSISKINKIPSTSICDVLRPINILCNIFGLHVFGFPRGHSRPIFSFVYTISLCCLFSSGWFYYSGQYSNAKIYKLDGTILCILIISNYTVVFVILMMGLYHSQATKLCIIRMNEIDKTLQSLGSSATFNCIYKRTIKDLAIGIIYLFLSLKIIIFDIALSDLPNYIWSIVYYVFLYTYSFMIKFLLMIEFLTVVRCIKSEFERTNELLSDINNLPNSSVALESIEHREADGSFSIERSLPVNSNELFIVAPSLRRTRSRMQIASQKINRSRMLLRTIRQIHLELYRVSKNLSNMYGIQISLEIAVSILLNTCALYFFYGKYVKYGYNTHQVILLLFATIWFCLQYGMKIFIVNFVCDKTTKEAERTSEIIHTFYGNNTDIEIRKEVEIFSLQMMQYPNKFSAFGLYNFNCKHICSCIGIITTYLVIMIQVANSVEEG